MSEPQAKSEIQNPKSENSGSDLGLGISDSVVGLKPWLPWPLSRSRWWNAPVPAKRLAALRIALAGVLLLDLLCTYLPHASALFGREGMGRPEVFEWMYRDRWQWQAVWEDAGHLGEDLIKRDPFHRTLSNRWRWSLLHNVEDPQIIRATLAAWLVATAFLLLGLGTRGAAALVWVLSTSFASINSYIDNGGDQIRYIICLFLILTPCGAVWSLDAWLRRRRDRSCRGVWVYPWALRLLFVQMVLMYWANGMYKLTGVDWPKGDSLYYVLNDLTLTRWSYAQFPIPYSVTRVLSWSVLVWELTFPLWLCLPWRWAGDKLGRVSLRRVRWLPRLIRHVPAIALLFGVAFHLGIGLSMELGFFVPYALCLYVPLLPVERLSSHVSAVSVGASVRTKSA
jgi:uncharacterized membrane protein YphA (DoxX/SURF4 family)